MNHSKARLFALLLGLPWATSFAAEPVQPAAQEPIQIEADSAEFSDATGVGTYTGHVILIRGNSRIEADEVVVHSQDNRLSRISATGNPIHFYQQSEGQDPIRGQSLRLEYDAQTEVLLLMDEAELQRGSDHFSGNRIQYDRLKEQVSASTDENGGQRVRITIQPRSNPEETAPAEEAQ